MVQTSIKLTTNKALNVASARGGAVFLEVVHRDGPMGTIDALYMTAEQANELAEAINRARMAAPAPAGLLGVLRHIGQA